MENETHIVQTWFQYETWRQTQSRSTELKMTHSFMDKEISLLL